MRSGGTVYYDFPRTGITGLYDVMVFFTPWEEPNFSPAAVEQFQFAWAAALGQVPKQAEPLSVGDVASALGSLTAGLVGAFERLEGYNEVAIPWLPSWHPGAPQLRGWEFQNLGKLRGFIIAANHRGGVPKPGQIRFGEFWSTAGHLCVSTQADGFDVVALPPALES